jgi:hypothetical protein
MVVALNGMIGARICEQQTGMWHVPDPLSEDEYARDESGNLAISRGPILPSTSAIHYNSSSYAYVVNNPILYVDLFGLDTSKAIELPIHEVKAPKNDNFSMPFWKHYIGPAMLTPLIPIPKKWLGLPILGEMHLR